MHTSHLLAAALFTSSLAVQAQSSDNGPVEKSYSALEEIVVTARRREEREQSVPIPITALSGADLDARGALDIRDLARVTPNLAFKNGGVAKNTAQVFLRGIGQVNLGAAQDPKVGIYLNGVYLARPQGAVFDLVDVDRVEVLRGPQGTLFGRNTTAGLVHILTKQPTQTPSASLQFLAGDKGQFGGGVTANLPFTDKLMGRLSAQHRESDGFVTNRFDGSKWQDENAQNAHASLLWNATENFEVLVRADMQRVREKSQLATCDFVGASDGSDAAGLDSLAILAGIFDAVRDTCLADSPYSGYQRDENPDSRIDAWGTTLTLSWDIAAQLKIASISAYRRMEEVNGSWGLTGDSPEGDLISMENPNSNPTDYRQFSQELRLSGTSVNDRLEWVGGLYYFDEQAKGVGAASLFKGWVPPDCAANPAQIPCFPNGAGGVLGDTITLVQALVSNRQTSKATNKSHALFAEFTYSLTESLFVTAGVRYTKDTRKLALAQELLIGGADPNFVCGPGLTTNSGACARKANFSETTPRIIVNYQLNNNAMLYGSWSEGYASGGFNQNPLLQSYEPETSRNWELGIKSTFLSNRIKFNANAFYNDYKNHQIAVLRTLNQQPFIATLNAQAAKLYGFEAEAVAILGGWALTASVGTLAGKYTKFTVFDINQGPPPDFIETASFRDLSDTELVLGAPYNYSIGVSYTQELAQLGSVELNLGWSQRGREHYGIDKLRNTRQDPFGVMDARITWAAANQRSSIAVVANNLLDEEYYDAALGAPEDVRHGFYWGAPRRVWLEFRHNFGG